jgi:hypothetical protein
MKLAELDAILDELERAGEISRRELKSRRGQPQQMITMK